MPIVRVTPRFPTLTVYPRRPKLHDGPDFEKFRRTLGISLTLRWNRQAIDCYPAGRIDLEGDCADESVAPMVRAGRTDPDGRIALRPPWGSTSGKEGGGETGHGLGLAIARAYAQAHGGDLVYDPRAGGARFELLIPQERNG